MPEHVVEAPAPSRADAPADRGKEILMAARKAFAAKGFDGASMQDLARSAGMSAGNFYRYFDSKDALIEAIVADELSQIEAIFSDIMASDDPQSAFMSALAGQLDLHMHDEESAIWTEIEAAAQRRESIGVIHQRMLDTVLDHQLRVFARIAEIPVDEARRRFRAHAEMILLMFRGTAVGRCTCRANSRVEDTRALRDLVLRSVETIVAEVASNKEARV